MATTTKLHELLAIVQQLKGQANTCRTELMATFDKKRHLFESKMVTFTPSEESAPAVTEQQSAIQTTVPKELAWLRGIWAKALDCSLRVEMGDTTGKADIVLDNGAVLATGVPVLALLELEKRMGDLQELAKAIPTLDPAKSFTLDTAKGDGIYVAREVRKDRTRKVQEPLVLIQPTKEHPGQAQLITKDVVTGRITELEWSGLLTPADKADIITRAEELARAVKAARCRASEVEVTTGASGFGDRLLSYAFTGQ